jgi:hypothetical protein
MNPFRKAVSSRRMTAWTVTPAKHQIIGVPYELLALGVGAGLAGTTFERHP